MDLFVFKAGIQSTVTRDSHVHIERQSETKHTTVEVYKKKSMEKNQKWIKIMYHQAINPKKSRNSLKIYTHMFY